jgi:hypothetical protein
MHPVAHFSPATLQHDPCKFHAKLVKTADSKMLMELMNGPGGGV